MARFDRVDRLLLLGLLPLVLGAIGLHVREIVRTGLAQPPVFAIVGDAADGHPRVGGFRLETKSEGTGLRVGDRLLRVGDVDLQGHGFVGFDAISLEQAGVRLATPLVYEREGVQTETVLRPTPHPVPWSRLPTLLLLSATLCLLLLRQPRTPAIQLFVAAWGMYAFLQAPFYGGPRAQTYTWRALYDVASPVAVFLLLRWARAFPDEVAADARPWKGWPWLGMAAYAAIRFNYHSGWPLPSQLVPSVSVASHAGLLAGGLALAARNYRHAEPVGRRRVKWILYGGLVATAPLIATQLVPLLAPDFAYFEELFGWSALITIAGPLGLLIAVGRYNLFDVDRLIGATAAYSIVAVGFLGLVLTIVPALANALAEASGLHAGTLRIALALAAAAVVVPANRRLRPQIDRWFFPERHALERGVRDLVRSLASAETEAEVWEVVSRRIEALLRPESLVLCTRDAGAGAGFAPADGADAPRFAARGAVALALERSGAPVPLAQETSSALEPAARDALRALGASIAVPIRRARDLAACLLLGPKRSRDVYTPTDLALLATVAESASAELLRIRSRELLRRERERAAELRASKEAADEAHRVRSRFLAAASHDLRQPLHALQLFAEALAGEQAAGQDARDLARNIHRSAGALAHMLNELLDVARLDVGAVQPQLANVSLGPLLERIGSELGPVAEAKGVALRIARTRGVVRSDPMLLARIVQNLVGNAVRYTSKGRVLVGCRRSGGSLRIGVWDTGPGIAAERRAEIFREFVQLEGGDRETGLGLGLSIVDRLARLLGHRTGLASTPGRGSLFWVEAPRVEAEAAEPAREEAAGGLAGRVVAVVDDDPRVLEATRRLLGAWGCEVLAGACAAEVRAQVATARRPLEAIVADFGLAGGRTGLEAIDEIRAAAGREVPALIVTGETEPTARAAILARGLPVLQKPVAPARLRAWLAHELAGGRTGADDTGR